MRGSSGPCYPRTAASQLYGVSYSISLLRLLLAKILTGRQHVPCSRVTRGQREIRREGYQTLFSQAHQGRIYMVSLPFGSGKSSPTPIFKLLTTFAHCSPAFKAGKFMLDAWAVPTTSGSKSSLLFFSIIFINFRSIGTRTRCRVRRLITLFLPTSTTGVGRACPARGALGVPRPGQHQTCSRFLIPSPATRRAIVSWNRGLTITSVDQPKGAPSFPLLQ